MDPQFIANWEPGMVIGLVAVVLGVTFLIVAVSVISIQVRKHGQAKLNTELTQNMLDQGMSIDEIERILVATHKHEAPWYAPQHTISAIKGSKEKQPS